MLALLVLVLCFCCPAVEGQQPHIVFIVVDDLGWNDVGWHNPDILTPNLDKLAREGVILNSSYVQPMCTPSRGAFMTGYYPYHLGLQAGAFNIKRPQFLPLNVTTLPEKLKQLGYSTHIVGKWHLGFCNWSYTPTNRGFDTYFGHYGGANHYTRIKSGGYDLRLNKDLYYTEEGAYSTHIFARRAVEIISRSSPSKPLFLYLPFLAVHRPLQVPKKYEDIYKAIKDKNRRVFSGMVTATDEAVGNITAALDKHGYMDNLILVFTTDNGGNPNSGASNWPLRGRKATLWEGGTRGVAFVYSKTLLQNSSYVNSGLIHAVDWFPTFVHIAGGKPETGIDGLNIWPVLSKNQPSPRREFVYNIHKRNGKYRAAIRVGDYKLIEGNHGGGVWTDPSGKRIKPNKGRKLARKLKTRRKEIRLRKSQRRKRVRKNDSRNSLTDPSGKRLKPKNKSRKLARKFKTMRKDIRLCKPKRRKRGQKNDSRNREKQKYKLFNIKDDPTETTDIYSVEKKIRRKLIRRLEFYKKSLVPALLPPHSKSSHPKHFNGTWSPGWC